jgi:hypothetical protein
MAKKKKITGQIAKRFTLEEIEMIVEALCLYRDANHRVVCGLFDKNGRMYSEARRESMESHDFMELLGSGEATLRHVPKGPRFTSEEEDTIEELWDVFVTGIGKIEEKIEEEITETVEENIGGVIDGLYNMLKGEAK